MKYQISATESINQSETGIGGRHFQWNCIVFLKQMPLRRSRGLTKN